MKLEETMLKPMREPMQFLEPMPFEEEKMLFIPNELRHYVFLPDYKSEMSMLYGLIDHWTQFNGDDYAPLNINILAMYYGTSLETLNEHLRILEKYDLVIFAHLGNEENNIFMPRYPLKPKDLFTKFPEAKKRYDETLELRESFMTKLIKG